MNRRELLALVATPVFGQGIASRGIKPLPRRKPSGLPFHAWFTDVAAQAGLTAPVIYGGVDRKDYIVETVGCGVAFFDYDNDGWLDIFVPSGTRLDGAPQGATNRLYSSRISSGLLGTMIHYREIVAAAWRAGRVAAAAHGL